MYVELAQRVAAGVAAGDPVVVDGAEVGAYTTVAGDRALAWIKRGVDLGDIVTFA